MEYLDWTGLQSLWTKITSDFTHTLEYDADAGSTPSVPKLKLTRTTHTPGGNTVINAGTITQETGRNWLGLGTMAYQNLENGKIPSSLFPDAILGQMVYGGIVSPTSGTTATAYLTDAARYKLGLPAGTDHISLTPDNTTTTGYVSNQGIYYIVQGSGTFASLDLNTGDWLVATGTAWKKIDNTDAVTGVKGSNELSFRTGNVSISAENIGLGNVQDVDIYNWDGRNGASSSTSNITKLGTITTGTWHGSQIAKDYLSTDVQTSLTKADNAMPRADIKTLTLTKNTGAETLGTFNPAGLLNTTIDIPDVASAATLASLINGLRSKGSQSLPVYINENATADVITSLLVPGNIQSSGGGVSAHGIADLSMSGGAGSGTVRYIQLGSDSPLEPDNNGIVIIPQAVASSGGVSGINGYMSKVDKTRLDRFTLTYIPTTGTTTGFTLTGENSAHASTTITMNAIPTSDITALS